MSVYACACGASEAEVHRVKCAAWMADERVSGPLKCDGCEGGFNSLRSMPGGKNLCDVCAYWRSKAEGK